VNSRGSLAWLGRQTHNIAYFPEISQNLPSFETRSFDWQEYKEYIFKNFSHGYAKDVFRLSKKYAEVLEDPQKASKLSMLPKCKRKGVMSSLSNLAKYLGVYQYWKAIMKNHGLKWERRSALEAIIDILNTNLEDTKAWLRKAIPKLPKEHGTVLVFDVLTGLRPSEACNSCKLITKLAKNDRLDQYLDRELIMLQHFRFKELFLRRNKNAYISFVSKDLLNLVLETEPRLSYTALRKKMNRLGIRSQMKQLRKLHGTLLRKHLPPELIDILQGRVSESVFLRFYYKPFLQEIREKSLKSIEPLQRELLTILS
jgi:integrase